MYYSLLNRPEGLSFGLWWMRSFAGSSGVEYMRQVMEKQWSKIIIPDKILVVVFRSMFSSGRRKKCRNRPRDKEEQDDLDLRCIKKMGKGPGQGEGKKNKPEKMVLWIRLKKAGQGL